MNHNGYDDNATGWRKCAWCGDYIHIGIRASVETRGRRTLRYFCKADCMALWAVNNGIVKRDQQWSAGGYRCACGCGQTNLLYDDAEWSWHGYARGCWFELPENLNVGLCLLCSEAVSDGAKMCAACAEEQARADATVRQMARQLVAA